MTKTKKNEPDVLIIGGGPAGMSAAGWCAELGLSAVLIDRQEEYGGQLLNIHNPIINYIGRNARNGAVMLESFAASLKNAGFERRKSADVSDIDVNSRTIVFGDGTKLSASAIIIATGVSRRELGVPGERDFIGKGILRSGAKEGSSVRGARVVIVGGGDAALENALILSKFAAKVTVVHRRSEFTARSEFFKEARRNTLIEFLPETKVVEIRGDSVVRAVVLRKIGSDQDLELTAENVLIRIGVRPNTELVRDQVDLDDRGYIVVNARCETNAPGIYACGDVSNPVSPTISTAAGTGSTAAKSIFDFLSKSDRCSR